MPYLEDQAQYHKYKITGNFYDLEKYVEMCDNKLLVRKIEEQVRQKYHGNYKNIIAYSGNIASVEGWGVGGGIQYELPFPVSWMQELGLLEEIY